MQTRPFRLCRLFYTLGWVTGTGGGISLRQGCDGSSKSENKKLMMKRREHVFIAPSGTYPLT